MRTLTWLPAVETPALIVREIEARDWRPLSRFMLVASYQRHIAMRLKDEDEVKAFVTRTVARQGDERRNVFHLAAEDKSSREAIGDGFIILQRKGLAEVGWGVNPRYWRKGLGTEIGRVLLGLAFERLAANRTWCKVMSSNVASTRLARRIGLKHLRSHANYPAGGGRIEAVEIFALTMHEYFEAPY
jgi:ribosomal-protein-alanine N-acetyltransferase